MSCIVSIYSSSCKQEKKKKKTQSWIQLDHASLHGKNIYDLNMIGNL